MHAATTSADFVRAIIEQPDDDALRLIYADFLEERGDRDRAEFIRVQIELAAIGDVACGRTGARLRGYARYTKRCRCTPCRLMRREYLSSRRHVFCDWPPEPKHLFTEDDWRRGFVEQVALTVEEWFGGRCPSCTAPAPRSSRHAKVRRADCAACWGSGLQKACGPALVRAAPLRRVAFPAKTPLTTFLGRYVWTRGWAYDTPEATWQLPNVAFDALIQSGMGDPRQDSPAARSGEPSYGFSTQQDARDAQSAASLAWARAQPVPEDAADE